MSNSLAVYFIFLSKKIACKTRLDSSDSGAELSSLMKLERKMREENTLRIFFSFFQLVFTKIFYFFGKREWRVRLNWSVIENKMIFFVLESFVLVLGEFLPARSLCCVLVYALCSLDFPHSQTLFRIIFSHHTKPKDETKQQENQLVAEAIRSLEGRRQKFDIRRRVPCSLESKEKKENTNTAADVLFFRSRRSSCKLLEWKKQTQKTN